MPMMRIDVSAFVLAPPETVMDVYADYPDWPSFIPTIKAVHLIRREGDKVVLAIDHVEGRVINELVVRRPDEIELWEAKRHYEARFLNRFTPVGDGTRFAISARIHLRPHALLLQPFVYGYARRRIEWFQVAPVKGEAEARARRLRSCGNAGDAPPWRYHTNSPAPFTRRVSRNGCVD